MRLCLVEDRAASDLDPLTLTRPVFDLLLGAESIACKQTRAFCSGAIPVSRGAVVDFLDFHLAGWHFYVFNLADAAISVGVGLMLIDSLLVQRRAPS